MLLAIQILMLKMYANLVKAARSLRPVIAFRRRGGHIEVYSQPRSLTPFGVCGSECLQTIVSVWRQSRKLRFYVAIYNKKHKFDLLIPLIIS